ncbi:MAG: hypothetical protein AAB249_04835, partial [Acidobacteriota bacterium]
MRRTLCAALQCATLWCAGLQLAAAAEPAREAAAPRTIALRCGRLLDVRTGALKEGALVIVVGERIERVLDAPAKAPDGAVVHDLSAYTVLPGLIDAHTHTFLQPG